MFPQIESSVWAPAPIVAQARAMMLSPKHKLPERPFTLGEALELGVSRWQLSQLVDNGQVRRPFTGVYQLASVPDDLVNRARAAYLVVRPFAVICDRTAAWIHGVDTFEFRELEILPPLECVVLSERSRVRRAGCAGGERDLTPGDIMTVGGIRVTTPVRTALDLACKLDRWMALAALDGFMRECGVTRAELEEQLPRYIGRRGVVTLRKVLPLGDGRAESPGESLTRMAIIDDGLPAPQLQHWVRENGVNVFRLDLAYPRHKVAVEYDGAAYHDSAEQRAADTARRDWLRQRGWTIIVVRKDSFGHEALAGWLQQLREALGLA